MTQPITILIADDHAVVRAGIRDILRRAPEVVVIGEADTAHRAVELALQKRPHVVLIDLAWLKDRTAGVAAIRQLKAEAPTIRILAFTAYPELIDEARAAGADMAVEKDALSDRATLVRHLLTTYQVPLPVRVDALPIEPLSDRERATLRLIAQGATDEQIAERLYIALPTAKKHVGSVFRKLNAPNRTAAVAIAYETGLLQRGDFFDR
jgi:NarL family two-component system response regulator LiaR